MGELYFNLGWIWLTPWHPEITLALRGLDRLVPGDYSMAARKHWLHGKYLLDYYYTLTTLLWLLLGFIFVFDCDWPFDARFSLWLAQMEIQSIQSTEAPILRKAIVNFVGL